MIRIREPEIEPLRSCPYFPDRDSQYRSMYVAALKPQELDDFLKTGWRKFGAYFFIPNCPNCQDCVPLRVETDKFAPSRSQRRVLKKNQDLEMKVQRLSFSQDVFDLYLKHSTRFKSCEIATAESFQHAFCSPAVPGIQLLLFLERKLVAAGFLDISSYGVSSVYFIFDPDHASRSLGTYGALMELKLAKALGKPYYYLGYWIEEHRSMNYKARFSPNQIFKWGENKWVQGFKG